ncbi:MAG TPA: thioredoxin domain-containing protein [Blastocatellia bacterium]|nr:thioredoxin domain-containing protein [Blastocatellia bacterium]
MIKRITGLTILVLAVGPSAGAQARYVASAGRAPLQVNTQSNAHTAVAEGSKPGAAAIVNGVDVSRKEVDAAITVQLEEFQKQIADARTRELDMQINTMLLEAEARRRGINTTRLLEIEVASKVAPPTDAEAKAFYDQNKNNIQGDFEAAKKDVIKYLLDQRRNDLASAYAKKLRGGARVVIPPSAKTGDRARVLATVNGRKITSGDVEDALLPTLFDLEEQLYELRKRQLDSKVNELLLMQESKRTGATPQAMYVAEVDAKTRVVTDADAEKFYQENRERISGEYAAVKGQVLEYLRAQEREKAELAFVEMLRKGATIKVLLAPPEPPVLKIAVAGRPSRGPAAAPVTIVEFTDFECPSCAYSQPVMERLVEEYPGKVRLVVCDFPLDQHAYAMKAAEAAEAAREQGKYWEYIALLFRNQKALSVPDLKKYASELGLDLKLFNSALDSGRLAPKVLEDLDQGNRLGVNSTPTVFINGRKIRDKSPEALKQAIEAALKDSPSAPQPAAARPARSQPVR